MTDKGCPAKKISSFPKQNASLCDSPHPQRIIAGPFPWYQLVARHLSFLPLPSMTEPPPPPPPSLSEHRKGLLAGYRRQPGENVLAQSRHRSQKSRHICNLHLQFQFSSHRHRRTFALYQNHSGNSRTFRCQVLRFFYKSSIVTLFR